MTQTYGPFAVGAGSNLGQDSYLDFLGVMLQSEGVNTKVFGDSTLQVYGNSSGMQVLMRAGSAAIRGAMYSNTADVTLAITSNSSGSTRIDRVVLRNDRAHAGGGQISPVVIIGTPGAGAPAITQTVGDIWDLTLAQVTVVSGATGINPGDVSDERQYLPQRIHICDTRYATPAVDGSKGRMFFDKNPAVNTYIITNGTAWAQIQTVVAGTAAVSYDSSTWGAGSVTARKSTATVQFTVNVNTLGITSGLVCTIPVGYRPAVEFDGTFGDDLLNPDGTWVINSNGQVHVRLAPGATFAGLYNLQFNAVYLAA